jgi:hypothetical protein
VATVTLAEIYVAQGHRERALETLRSRLVREPGDAQARSFYERLLSGDVRVPQSRLKPESIDDAPTVAPIAEELLADSEGRSLCETVREVDDRIAVRWAAGARVPSDATVALEVLTIRARWDGPELRREVLVVDTAGSRDIVADAQTVVRVAFGLLTPDGVFSPLAHAPEVERDASGALFAWTQRGRERTTSAQSMSRG